VELRWEQSRGQKPLDANAALPKQAGHPWSRVALPEPVDQHGVAIRAGHHCAKPLMHRLGVAATARASFYIYNDRDEVDALIDALLAAREVFGL